MMKNLTENMLFSNRYNLLNEMKEDFRNQFNI